MNLVRKDATEPVQNEFNFTAADIVRDFAKKNNFVLRGHTLVWHEYVQILYWCVTFISHDEQATCTMGF